MRKFFSIFTVFLAVCCTFVWGGVGYLQTTLPDRFTVSKGEDVHIGRLVDSRPVGQGTSLPAAVLQEGDTYTATLCMGGIIPIKTVSVSVTELPVVTVCGTPFGIKLYTDGVLIVGISDVSTAAGACNPAAAAGIRVGDTILTINGQAVTTNREVSRLVNDCGGKPLRLHLRREGVEFDASFTPARPQGESGYRAGLWVRDSTAGVGILTFYDPQTGAYGGLGHPVCDVDTGVQLAISGGEIVPATVFDVKKGRAGTPGELCGSFAPGTLGRIEKNSTAGLYGTLTGRLPTGTTLPVARRQQVQTGKAQVLTTLESETPQLYDVEIRQVRHNASATSRHMVVEITDPALLDRTGGIVQGMSGSPIIQNGKLIGAVTHVLVDDPTRGYGIFAENMLETARSVEKLKEAG